MTHLITPFDDEFGYHGFSCSCGFKSATGFRESDSAICKFHLVNEARLSEAQAFAEMMRHILKPEIVELRATWLDAVDVLQRLI